MELQDQPKPQKPKVAVATIDPLEEIATLVREGKISSSEADRVRAALSSEAMDVADVHAYVRQKRR
jgi:hypothetical protein